MNIELANGSEGYIPPPEQHVLGGYTTWPARTAALEVQAEPKIVATVLGLLEQVAGRPRRKDDPKPAPYTEHILAARPVAYWRLEEMEGKTAHDATGHEHDARFEKGIAFYLPGPDLPGFATRSIASTAHRTWPEDGSRRTLIVPAESSSVEFWFWNGLPNDARAVTGYLLRHRKATATPWAWAGHRGRHRRGGSSSPKAGRSARRGQDRDRPQDLAPCGPGPQRPTHGCLSRRQPRSRDHGRPRTGNRLSRVQILIRRSPRRVKLPWRARSTRSLSTTGP